MPRAVLGAKDIKLRKMLLSIFLSYTVRLNVGRIRTNYAAGADAGSNVFGLNYAYALSKRTSLYAGVGRVSNNAAAQVGLEAGTRAIPASSGKGSDPSALTLGIRHAF